MAVNHSRRFSLGDSLSNVLLRNLSGILADRFQRCIRQKGKCWTNLFIIKIQKEINHLLLVSLQSNQLKSLTDEIHHAMPSFTDPQLKLWLNSYLILNNEHKVLSYEYLRTYEYWSWDLVEVRITLSCLEIVIVINFLSISFSSTWRIRSLLFSWSLR